jgi:hypothetical protein
LLKYIQEENAIDSAIIRSLEKDAFRRNELIFKFISKISLMEHNTGNSVFLDGPWGSGKTFFVRSICLLLEPLPLQDERINQIIEKAKSTGYDEDQQIDEAKTKLYPVYFNAWSHDDEIDPLVSLLTTIAGSLSCKIEDGLKDEKAKSLLTAIVKPIVNKYADFDTLLECLDSSTNDIFQPSLDTRKRKEQVHKLIKSFLDDTGKEKLVLFIDELDRCKPSYAIELLERIKYYFDSENVLFVFSLNMAELSNVLSSYFGNGFNGSSYLTKFYNHYYRLPNLPSEKYLEHHELKSAAMVDSRFTFGLWLADHYNLSIREKNRFFNEIQYSDLAVGHSPSFKANEFCSTVIYPLTIILRMRDLNAYEEFITGFSVSPLLDLLTTTAKETISKILELGNDDSAELEKSINKIYDFLFCEHDWTDRTLIIGDAEFDSFHRNWIQTKTGCLFSSVLFNTN